MTKQDRQEKLFRAIGYVGDDLIQRADAPAQAERKQPVHTDEWRCENIETEICQYNGWKPETVWNLYGHCGNGDLYSVRRTGGMHQLCGG